MNTNNFTVNNNLKKVKYFNKIAELLYLTKITNSNKLL